MKFSCVMQVSLLSSCALALAGAASAAPLTTTNSVASTAVIYAAGTQSALASAAGGTTATAITIANNSSYFTFSVPTVSGVTQTITLNGGGSYNDADGVGGAVSTSSNTGYGSISGIAAPHDGYLVGVFVAAGGPTGAAPASLDYTSGVSTSSASYNPLLDQVFFIGDGLTGDGTGATQLFYVPTGATTLYLGISDAGGYNGGPGSYGDNSGSFSGVIATDALKSTTAVTPEPSSLFLLGTGVLGAAGILRRRMTAS